VKYHLGYSQRSVTPQGKRMHLSLCFNPSHLEFVDPVVLGRVRAKQDRRGDTERRQVLPL
jgi:2-oxoglutarate dehydrogenase E1 component